MPPAQPGNRRHALLRALAAGSAAAGVIHLAFTPDHLREWVPLGVGFAAAGVFQILWAGALLRRESRRVLAFGALGSLFFVGVWLVSRTVGLPVGPQALQVESIGVPDALCVLLELPVAAGALSLLRRPGALRRPAGALFRALAAGAAALSVATAGVAVASPGHVHAGHAVVKGADCDPRAPMRKTGVDANHDGVDDGVQAYFRCQLVHEHDGHHGYTG